MDIPGILEENLSSLDDRETNPRGLDVDSVCSFLHILSSILFLFVCVFDFALGVVCIHR